MTVMPWNPEKVSASLVLELQAVVSHSMWVLGTKFWLSRRASILITESSLESIPVF